MAEVWEDAEAGWQWIEAAPTRAVLAERAASLIGSLPGVAAFELRLGPEGAAASPLGSASGVTEWDIGICRLRAVLEAGASDAVRVALCATARLVARVAASIPEPGVPDEVTEVERMARRVGRTGAFSWDQQTGELYWSEEAKLIVGLDPSGPSPTIEEAVALIHGEDLPRWQKAVWASLEGGEPHRLQFRVRRPDGRWIWVSTFGEAVRDESGRPLRLLGVVVDMTAELEAAEELGRYAERFRSLMEHTAEGFYLVEPTEPISVDISVEDQIDRLYESKVVECNDAFARMYGYPSAEQIVGATLTQLHGSAAVPSNRAFLERFIEDGYRIQSDLSHERDQHGRPVTFSNNAVGVVEGGKLLRVWGTQTDVSELERSKAEAVRERRLSEALVDGLPGLFYVLDEEGGLLRWSPGLEAWVERPLEGVDFASLFSTADREAVARSRRRCLEEGASQTEARLEGCGRTFVLSCRRVRLEDRNLIVGTGMDVTERNRAAAALAESEALHRALFEASPVAVVLAEPNTVGRLNPRALELFACTAEQAAAAMPADFSPACQPDGRPSMEGATAYIEAALAGAPQHFEWRHRRLNGPEFDAEVRLSRVEIAGRGHVLAMVTDISAQKAEEEARATLERQIEQAQRLESVGRLAGGVAHDLNNLLTPILGYAELLLDGAPHQEGLEECVEGILGAGSRARGLVRQLLAFGRRQDLELQPLALNEVIEAFAPLLRRTVPEDIHLQLNLSPSLPAVRADVGQIEQVLLNLAVNGADAMPEGGTLRIGTAAVEANVRLQVSDTGTGMDEATRNRAFEPFFSTKGDRGTGLGLSTVYGIVHQHGGRVLLDSALGRGTTVTVELAASSELASNDLATVDVVRAQPAAAILVVEDDHQVRALARRMLQRMGHRVVAVGSGSEALDCLRAGSPSFALMLTDVVLPGSSGPAVFREAQRIRPNLRVLYMTGYPEITAAERGLMAGARVLRKPFTRAELAQRVAEVLDSGPQARAEA